MSFSGRPKNVDRFRPAEIGDEDTQGVIVTLMIITCPERYVLCVNGQSWMIFFLCSGQTFDERQQSAQQEDAKTGKEPRVMFRDEISHFRHEIVLSPSGAERQRSAAPGSGSAADAGRRRLQCLVRLGLSL